MISQSDCEQFSQVLDGLISPEDSARSQSTSLIIQLIENQPVKAFGLSIYKTKLELDSQARTRASARLGPTINSNISREIYSRRDSLSKEQLGILKESMKEIMPFMIQTDDKFTSNKICDSFSNVIITF